MTAKSLFNLVLKILGIYFFKDIIIAIPALFGAFIEFWSFDSGGSIFGFLFSFLVVGMYALIIYFLLVKTDWIIAKLKLTENFPEDPIPFNIHRSTVLSIALIVAGILLIIQAIPELIRGLTQWYQYNRASRGILNAYEPFDYSYLLMYAAQVIVGLLLLGNQKLIVNYIEYRRKK